MVPFLEASASKGIMVHGWKQCRWPYDFGFGATVYVICSWFMGEVERVRFCEVRSTIRVE